jgi:hypothetical protein
MSSRDQLAFASCMCREDGIVGVCESESMLAGSLVCGGTLDQPEGRRVALRRECTGEVLDCEGVVGFGKRGLAESRVGVRHLVKFVLRPNDGEFVFVVVLVRLPCEEVATRQGSWRRHQKLSLVVPLLRLRLDPHHVLHVQSSSV